MTNKEIGSLAKYLWGLLPNEISYQAKLMNEKGLARGLLHYKELANTQSELLSRAEVFMKHKADCQFFACTCGLESLLSDIRLLNGKDRE